MAARPLVTVALPAALVVYAAAILLARGWRFSGLVPALAATLVAALLWSRHPRARFAAYVLFSAMLLRGLLRGDSQVAVFAVAAILAMQVPSALRAWPRLRPGLRWRR